MSKVRINDLARELEVKSRPILDALEAIGVSGKTHSSSIEADQAERVRDYFKNGGRSSPATRQPLDTRPKFDLSKVSKPGDALKAILERKQAEAAAKAAPPRPTAVVAPPPSVVAAPAAPKVVAAAPAAAAPHPPPPPPPPAPPTPRRPLPRNPAASFPNRVRRRTSSLLQPHRPSRASLPQAP
jgi:translation initiation factor IF-2